MLAGLRFAMDDAHSENINRFSKITCGIMYSLNIWDLLLIIYCRFLKVIEIIYRAHHL